MNLSMSIHSLVLCPALEVIGPIRIELSETAGTLSGAGVRHAFTVGTYVGIGLILRAVSTYLNTHLLVHRIAVDLIILRAH